MALYGPTKFLVSPMTILRFVKYFQRRLNTCVIQSVIQHVLRAVRHTSTLPSERGVGIVKSSNGSIKRQRKIAMGSCTQRPYSEQSCTCHQEVEESGKHGPFVDPIMIIRTLCLFFVLVAPTLQASSPSSSSSGYSGGGTSSGSSSSGSSYAVPSRQGELGYGSGGDYGAGGGAYSGGGYNGLGGGGLDASGGLGLGGGLGGSTPFGYSSGYGYGYRKYIPVPWWIWYPTTISYNKGYGYGGGLGSLFGGGGLGGGGGGWNNGVGGYGNNGYGGYNGGGYSGVSGAYGGSPGGYGR
ncbi:hypothetical protein BV898_00498 [Hypsibius exemplaris]|uniref:Uncharacterized protein n=1 Tax=Hypsibius exemplaris TaxID=2072580 RepID=A0A1W0XDN3_HYPEX|nr:hypothetical protein BV898_00498 [Hypsibius exemplaris]